MLLREWLVENIKGIGYKEACHFLRNIGLGSQLAILDRHILKNLELYQVIEKIPVSISKKKYIEIEKQMILFSKKDACNIVLHNRQEEEREESWQHCPLQAILIGRNDE